MKRNILLRRAMAREILAMAHLDASMLRAHIKDRAAWNDFAAERNADTLKGIITQIGWPTRSKVGPKASQYAVSLVRRASHDRHFQKICLSLMKGCSRGQVPIIGMRSLETSLYTNGYPRHSATNGTPTHRITARK